METELGCCCYEERYDFGEEGKNLGDWRNIFDGLGFPLD